MILQPKQLYRLNKQNRDNHYLFKTDECDPYNPTSKDVIAQLPANSLMLLTRKGRLRFLQVIYRDTIGFIWIPLNVATHNLLSEAKRD